MSEQTDFVTRPNGSSIFGVSVRGWLAMMLTFTVCLIVAGNILMASMGWTSTNVQIPEPLYSGFLTALGFYLGQTQTKRI
jgi:hypothetical protein